MSAAHQTGQSRLSSVVPLSLSLPLSPAGHLFPATRPSAARPSGVGRNTRDTRDGDFQRSTHVVVVMFCESDTRCAVLLYRIV